MNKTKIDWCDSTWNPVTGCLHGCEYCYAREYVRRFGKNLPDLSDFASRNKGLHLLDNKIDSTPYPYGFEPTFHAYHLNDYISKKDRNIFVCSMADLFGEWVPDEWIKEVFAACEKAQQHNYLFLTKNPQRYVELAEKGILRCADNMWYGSTVTNPDTIAFYGKGDYKTFISAEPLLKPFTDFFNISGIDWIIVGAETGRRKNKVIPKREWIEQIVEDCRKYKIPLFMKSSLSEIWVEPLIQEFPEGMLKRSKLCRN